MHEFAQHAYKQFGVRVFILAASKDESDEVAVSW